MSQRWAGGVGSGRQRRGKPHGHYDIRGLQRGATISSAGASVRGDTQAGPKHDYRRQRDDLRVEKIARTSSNFNPALHPLQHGRKGSSSSSRLRISYKSKNHNQDVRHPAAPSSSSDDLLRSPGVRSDSSSDDLSRSPGESRPSSDDQIWSPGGQVGACDDEKIARAAVLRGELLRKRQPRLHRPAGHFLGKEQHDRLAKHQTEAATHAKASRVNGRSKRRRAVKRQKAALIDRYCSLTAKAKTKCKPAKK